MATQSDDGLALVINVLKIALGLGVMIAAIGGALWYANSLPAYSPALEQAKQEISTKPANSTPNSGGGDKSWGIAHDSPIRRR